MVQIFLQVSHSSPNQ